MPCLHGHCPWRRICDSSGMRAPLAVGLLAALVTAQVASPTQDERRAAKLAAPFLQKAPWHTDWDAALAAARAQRRLVFGYFTTVNH